VALPNWKLWENDYIIGKMMIQKILIKINNMSMLSFAWIVLRNILLPHKDYVADRQH
jgi:hypothetical protein